MDDQQTEARAELAKAVAHFGNQSKLARKLGVSDPTVSEWMSGERPIPPLRALQLEQLIPGKKVKASRLNAKVEEILGQPDQKRQKAA